MSYVPTGAVVSPEARKALQVAPEEVRAFGPETRMNYVFRYHEIKATRVEAFWNAVSAFATAAIPLLAFLGIERATRK